MTLRRKSLAQWMAIAELPEDARRLADPTAEPRVAIDTLANAGRPADAVRLLAHLLPTREAVLWAWSCAKRSASPAHTDSLAATERWIGRPTDENRRAAMSAAENAQLGTAAGAAGLAAFLSGDSLAPAGAPPVPPPDFLAAKAVTASILLSAVADPAPAKYRESLVRGLELAQRIHLWERTED
jgi:hypothetical protein